MIERKITVILPDRGTIEYRPTHAPLRVEDGVIQNLFWEQQDGSVFTVAINTEQVALIEETLLVQDKNEDMLRLIKEAKARDTQ